MTNVMDLTESVIKDLHNKYWKTRANAARKLGEMNNPVAVTPLIEVLWDEERVVKESAIEALGKIGSPALIPLINALYDESKWKIRSEVEKSLIKIGKPTVKALLKHIKNYEESSFHVVSRIVGEIRDTEAVLPLINALEKGDIPVRLASIQALGDIRDKRAVKPIISDIKKHGHLYGNYLGLLIPWIDLGEPDVIPLLLDMLKGEYRWYAAEFLGRYGGLAVKPLLFLINDKDINNQGLVVAALGYTKAEDAVKPLIKMLYDKDKIISWRAAMALVEIGTASAEQLIQILTEENENVRSLIAESLGGDRRTLMLLEKLINNDKNEEVRQTALKALEKLQPKNMPVFKDKKINIEKDLFALRIGLSDGFFSAAIAEDIFYLNLTDQDRLRRGELSPPVSVPYRYSGGRTIPADFISVGISCFLISDRLKKLFVDCNFKGWKTYPISLYDKSGNLINGYHGFSVTGKTGKIDYSRSKIVSKPGMFGKPDIVKKGIYFDESIWDGNDFMFAGHILVTGRLVEALRRTRPKVKNWEATPASEYELPLFYDALDENFLTEDERDKVNELRSIFKNQHQHDLHRTTEILAQEEIDNELDLLHLVKSIVQNGCMFDIMSDQGFCKVILKSLSETGQPGINRMIEALIDKDWEVRAGGAWALGKLKVREAVEPLLHILKDDEEENVRREAVMALGEIEDARAVTSLVEVLKGEDAAYVRCGAALALGVIGDQRAIQPLISVLSNEEEVFVLSDAASALGKFGNPQAVLPLISLFENEDSNLAEHIKWALVSIGQPAVIPLIQALKHSHPLVRREAARTLGEMHEQKAVLPLIERLTLEEDPEVLSFAVEALGQLGDRRAVKPLLSIINTATAGYLQEEIRIALQKIQGAKGV